MSNYLINQLITKKKSGMLSRAFVFNIFFHQMVMMSFSFNSITSSTFLMKELVMF